VKEIEEVLSVWCPVRQPHAGAEKSTMGMAYCNKGCAWYLSWLKDDDLREKPYSNCAIEFIAAELSKNKG